MIHDIDIARVLIDTGSLVDIIFKDTLEKMKINQSEIVENPSPLVGLSGEATIAFGSINLAVKAGTMTKVTEFLVVDRPASYNVIMGTQWLNSMCAIPSTYHLCLKFPTPNGIKVIWGNPRVTRVCFTAELKRKRPDLETIPRKVEKTASGENTRNRDSAELFWQSRKIAAVEEKRKPTFKPVVTVCLDEAFPERCVEVGANLREPLRTEFITCLKKKLNTFAWATEDMPGNDINITCHELNIDPTFKPVKQKRRYNQIRMNSEDREKTAFITDRGTYCYEVMPFGLKKAGATYQRLVNRMFSDQLGKTMEVYIGDMLVKSLKAKDHVSH
ncbi:uncharacterized protein LOC125592715 [Brassica napus]|uniref:uncharacterized protein LOC125592715 n=1 Tax=Brassica napus TaxID=3708 RepID=UPI00207A2836|nr:uncharacterized protein LOC125592715 [Brassica napus]